MAENSLVRHLNENISYLETLIQHQKNEPYFYFKVKLIANKNNALSLVDKVIGIGKSHIFIFWAQESQSAKFQALNNLRKQGINFDLIEFPQQKIPLEKFDQFSLIPNSDSQFVPYLKSIIPSFSFQQYPNVCESFCLLFLKSTQQYETQCILCPTYTIGLEMVYVLQMMKFIKSYQDSIEKYQSSSGGKPLILDKGNLKLMRMMSNLKFGFVDVDPQNFGYNSKSNYDQIEEKRQIVLYEQAIQEVLKKGSYQFSQPFSMKFFFKIIDEKSKNYASTFLLSVKDKIQTILLSGCEINDQNLQSLLIKVRQQSSKSSPFRQIENPLFSALKHLDLSENKLTDGIFNSLCKLINPQKQTSNQPKFIFQVLQSINLSKNFITLQSDSHKNFINVLQNLSSFVLKINLSFNKIKSLQFFEKYLLSGDAQAGASNSPVQYIDLIGNSSISQSMKQSFISRYIEKSTELDEKFMAEIGFIINFGQVGYNRDKNILKYLVLLEKYLQQQKEDYLFQQINSFGMHFYRLASVYYTSSKTFESSSKKNVNPTQITTLKKQITLSLSKSLQTNQQRSLLMASSLQSFRSSILMSPRNEKNSQNQGKILEDFSKAFYLKDYKMLSESKNQLIQSHKIKEQELQKTFALQWSKKRQQQKRIIYLVEKVCNFIDGKGKDGVKTLLEQKLINQKLDSLVGLIRRKGLEGQGSDFVVYLKDLRDKMIENYLGNQKQFGLINPIYDVLKRMKANYISIFQKAIKQKQSFMNVNYIQLSQNSQQQIEKRFLQNKQKQLGKMNQSLYDRLRYLLIDSLTQQKTIHLLETLIKELKLFPTRAVRYHNKFISEKNSISKPFLRAKQKLTSRQLSFITNRMQYLRLYSIVHYPFNSKITAEISRSGYQGVLSCLNFSQARQQQALQFIEVVNNFIAFLFYTPDTISQQTVTYINYIANYLNQLALDTFEDIEWKEFLMEQFYLHLINFKPQQKLNKGLMLNVFQYFTARLICRHDMEKYIIAYLLENESSSVDKSYLVLSNLTLNASFQNNLTQQQKSLKHLQNRETKIQWVIPNQFLVNSFLNQGKLCINIRFDTTFFINETQKSCEQVEIYVHETCTIAQLVEMLLDQNNLYRQKIPLIKKESLGNSNNDQLTQSLKDCWLFEIVNKSNKLQYFQAYQSYRYIGEIIADKFQNEQKVVFYLRKTTIGEQYHNENYLSEEIQENELIQLFYKIVTNLSMSVQMISKLPKEMLLRSYYQLNSQAEMEFTPSNFVLAVFSQIVYIIYLQKLKSIKVQKQHSQQNDEESIEQQKEKILQQTIEILLDGKSNQFNEKIIVNCKNFTIEDKITIRSQVKNLIQTRFDEKENTKQKITSFIKSLGGLGYCQTLVSKSQIFIINNRFIIQGKLLQHTNESNEIVNFYSKFQSITFFNQLIDLRLHEVNIMEQSSIRLSMKKLTFNDQKRQFLIEEKIIQGESYFLLCLYNQLIAVCKNILNFDSQLLYRIQEKGIAKKNNKTKIITSKTPSKTKQNNFHLIPEKFIKFSITRNKENESYERISQIHIEISKEKLKSQKSQNFYEKNIMQSQQEEVYSRKSSKRSLKENKSKKQLKKQNSKIQNYVNQENDDTSSLIPSRQSIYLENQLSQQIILQSQSKVETQQIQLNTQDIIKQISHQQNESKQNIKSPESKAQKIDNQQQPIITNQQRKSRRQMPKRRSSRQKDK